MIKYVGSIFLLILAIALIESIVASVTAHILAIAILIVLFFACVVGVLYMRSKFGDASGRGRRKY